MIRFGNYSLLAGLAAVMALPFRAEAKAEPLRGSETPLILDDTPRPRDELVAFHDRRPAGQRAARKAAQDAATRRLAEAELKRQRRRQRNLAGHA